MFPKSLTTCIAILLPALLWAQTDVKTTENATLPNIDYKQAGAPMPPFMFMSYNDTTPAARKPEVMAKKYTPQQLAERTANDYTFMNEADFDNKGNLFVMMFNPTCSHCEDVTFMLEKNATLFKKTKVVLLANRMMNMYIPYFAERHQIAYHPFMYIGYDSSRFIDNAYLYQALPQINIYGPDRKLIKTYAGEVPMDTLKKYIDPVEEGRKKSKRSN
jgi:hypothetical protein